MQTCCGFRGLRVFAVQGPTGPLFEQGLAGQHVVVTSFQVSLGHFEVRIEVVARLQRRRIMGAKGFSASSLAYSALGARVWAGRGIIFGN